MIAFAGRLDCPEGLALLEAVAALAFLDSVVVETGHSKWQQDARLKGLQTIATTTALVSATFCLHRQSQDEAANLHPAVPKIGRRPKPRAEPKRRGPKPNPDRPPTRVRVRVRKRTWQKGLHAELDCKRHGGGGPYRAFVSKHCCGIKGLFGRFTKAMNKMYRKLKAENGAEYQDLKRIGTAATAARASTQRGNSFTGTTAMEPCRLQTRSEPQVVESLVPVGAMPSVHPPELDGVLALAHHTWADVELRRLRAVLRQVSRDCKERDRQLSLDLARWTIGNAESLSELSPPSVVFGARQPSADDSFRHFRWCPPAMRLSEHVLDMLGDPAHHPCDEGVGGEQNLHAKLRSEWATNHVVMEHSKCCHLGTGSSTKLYSSACRLLGMCLCQEDRKDLVDFRASLVALMQVLMKKCKQNRYKSLFEAARGVLRLDWFDRGDDVECDEPLMTQWYSVPYVNQNSWSFALVQLWPDPDYENVRIARAFGHIALRAAPLGDAVDETVHGPDQPFHSWGLENCPRIFHDADLGRRCVCSIYEIVESDDRIVVEFVPACVEVTLCPREPAVVWPLPSAATVGGSKAGAPGNGSVGQSASSGDRGPAD
jgi:hypothetical protein